MKRRTLVVSFLAILAVLTFVSCSSEVNEPENRIGRIAFGADSAKTINTVVTYNSDVESLYWYYKATKNDDGYTTGRTSGYVPVVKDVDGNATTGLSGQVLDSVGFSYGFWNIEFRGYSSTADSSSEDNAKFTATLTNFLVKDDMNYATVEIKVGAGADTTIKFGAIYFEATNITADSEFALSVEDNKGTVAVPSYTADVVVEAKKVTFNNLAYNLADGQDITGSHTMKFVLTQRLSSKSGTGSLSISAALYTLKFDVVAGTNTLISGDMIKNDQTGDIQINGGVSVPETTLYKVIPVTSEATADSATVKTKTTITVGDLTVTYPEGAKIVPGTDGLAGTSSANDMTSDGVVGFEYKDTSSPSGITIETNSTSERYELALNASTSTDADTKNTEPIAIKKYIGKSLNIVNIYHESEALNKLDSEDATKESGQEYYYYDSSSGYLTLYVFHSSNFYIVSEKAVASVGGTLYYSLSSAYTAAAEGSTITLLADCSSATISVGKNVTVDLNGYTLTGSSTDGILFTPTGEKTLTIDGTKSGSKVVGTVKFASDTTGNVTVNGGTYEGNGEAPFYVDSGVSSACTIAITGATITGNTDSADNATSKHGLYLAGDNATTLGKCTIAGGNTGIEVHAGTVTLNDCTVSGSEETLSTADSVVKGAAIAVSQTSTDATSASVIVNGGTYTGNHAIYEGVAKEEETTSAVALSITDGSFTGSVESANCTGFITGGTFSVDPTTYVAEGYRVAEDGSLYTVERRPVVYIANGNQWYELIKKYATSEYNYTMSDIDVVLTGDCDMTDYDISEFYIQYVYNVNIDGDEHTISNLDGCCLFGSYYSDLIGTNSFKDLNVSNVNADCSVFGYGTCDNGVVTFDDVNLTDCSTQGGSYLYYCQTGTVSFTSCSTTNCYVLGGYMASGGFLGNIGGPITIDGCSFGGTVVSNQSVCAGFVGQPSSISIKNSKVKEGTILKNIAGGRVATFVGTKTSEDYNKDSNAFNGTMITNGTAYPEGFSATAQSYTPLCTADDFSLEVGTESVSIKYTGDNTLPKISVACYVIRDYYSFSWKEFWTGYNFNLLDKNIISATVAKDSSFTGLPLVKDMKNVVSSVNTAPVGLKCYDISHSNELFDGTVYLDAQTRSGGYYMLSGTSSNGTAAVEPETLPVYIKITVLNDSGILDSAVLLSYNVTCSGSDTL